MTTGTKPDPSEIAPLTDFAKTAVDAMVAEKRAIAEYAQRQQEIVKAAQTINSMPLAYSIPKAAREIGVSEKVLKREIRLGRIGYYRAGSQIRIDAAAIVAYKGRQA